MDWVTLVLGLATEVVKKTPSFPERQKKRLEELTLEFLTERALEKPDDNKLLEIKDEINAFVTANFGFNKL